MLTETMALFFWRYQNVIGAELSPVPETLCCWKQQKEYDCESGLQGHAKTVRKKKRVHLSLQNLTIASFLS